VLTMPENEQLIYKQFAVTFTNLVTPTARRATGSRQRRDAASQLYAKAIKALQTAKQNTRFFPKNEYDEALHDLLLHGAVLSQALPAHQAGLRETARAWRGANTSTSSRRSSRATDLRRRPRCGATVRAQIQEP